jgi:type VI secretion system secreted protein Hcp
MPFDAFLKVEGLSGETRDERHRGAVEVLGFSLGVSRSVATSETPEARCEISPLVVKKFIDKVSPKLAQACAAGDRFRSATLTLTRAGGNKETFYEIHLVDVAIASVDISGDPQGEWGIPAEEVRLSFTRIEWKYIAMSERGTPGGNVISGWDLKNNRKP